MRERIIISRSSCSLAYATVFSTLEAHRVLNASPGGWRSVVRMPPPPRPRKRPNPHPITREVSNSLARRLDFGGVSDDVRQKTKGDGPADTVPPGDGPERLTCVDTNVLSWSGDSDCKVVEELILRKFDLDLRYGPCCGISRQARYDRAKAFGLNPPEAVGRALKRIADANAAVTPSHLDKRLDEFSVLDQHMVKLYN